jgi:hypothetical protein
MSEFIEPRRGERRAMARKATKVRRAIGRIGNNDIDPGIRTHIEKLATQSMISMNRVVKKAVRANEKLRAENAKLKAQIEKLKAR